MIGHLKTNKLQRKMEIINYAMGMHHSLCFSTQSMGNINKKTPKRNPNKIKRQINDDAIGCTM